MVRRVVPDFQRLHFVLLSTYWYIFATIMSTILPLICKWWYQTMSGAAA